jgi:hypothetical protein
MASRPIAPASTGHILLCLKPISMTANAILLLGKLFPEEQQPTTGPGRAGVLSTTIHGGKLLGILAGVTGANCHISRRQRRIMIRPLTLPNMASIVQSIRSISLPAARSASTLLKVTFLQPGRRWACITSRIEIMDHHSA